MKTTIPLLIVAALFYLVTSVVTIDWVPVVMAGLPLAAMVALSVGSKS